jgi:phage FluMu protein Com
MGSDETVRCANCAEDVKPITKHESPTGLQIKCPLCEHIDYIPKP